MRTDLYKYFRVEARELTEQLGQGVLALEKGEGGEIVAGLLRAAHTLKGAARVVKQGRIAENAHAIEEILAPFRDVGKPAPRQDVDRLLSLLDEISALISGLDGLPGEKPAAKAGLLEEPLGLARSDTAEVDALLDGVLETGIRLRSFRGALGAFARVRRVTDALVEQAGSSSRHAMTLGGAPSSVAKTFELSGELRTLIEGVERSLSTGVDQAERELEQVRDIAERLRLVPASALFPLLERTVRDVAQALGKEASFQGKGGDVRVESRVLGQVQGALVQVIRNAVAHGIESSSERMSARKPPVGTVEVSVERRGNRVACVCRDDGRGIDVAAVRVVAERAGLVSKDAAPFSAESLLSLLMKGGFSTSGDVTEVSGRGIGLDIVSETAARLGGTVTLRTEARRGTTLELVVPVSLSALDALLVVSGGETLAIPIEAVRGTLRLVPSDVVRTPDGESILHEGRVLPLSRLARSVATSTTARGAAPTFAVVVQGSSALAAVSVDRLVGTANIVVRPLPALSPADPIVAGVSLDSEGMPRLVLDPEGLVTAALDRRGAVAESEVTQAARILVIDDSLTTRVLEQSILESAGYDVDLASSAEEGLEKASQRQYGLFLVDVEMPGMDGFSFLEKTRADPVLRVVPAILVSSRNAAEDLQRGREVGASAYVVKGEFDQAGLLTTIRGLLSP